MRGLHLKAGLHISELQRPNARLRLPDDLADDLFVFVLSQCVVSVQVTVLACVNQSMPHEKNHPEDNLSSKVMC